MGNVMRFRFVCEGEFHVGEEGVVYAEGRPSVFKRRSTEDR
jgi:hypothetical protein